MCRRRRQRQDAAAPFGFAPDLPCRDVILRKDQQRETSNIGRNARARPERKQRLPDYVGRIFALTPHHCGVPVRAPIIVAQQRRTAGTPPCRHDCRLSNEDRRRAELQDPVNRERRKIGLGQEPVESATLRLRHQPAFREDGRGTNAARSRARLTAYGATQPPRQSEPSR
jgi:hypothetical protein